MTHSATLHIVALGLDVGLLALLGRELGSQYSVTATDSPVDAMTALIGMPTRTAVLANVDLESFGGDRRGVAFLRVARFRVPRCLRILVTRQPVMLDDALAQDIDAVFTVPWDDGALSSFLACWSRAGDDRSYPESTRGNA